MTAQQEEKYEEVKSYYRNKILDNIEKSGVKKSQLLLLQGLTQLRQIANHPKMTDPEYTGDSGKLEDVIYMIENALSEGHKILIFSQFVKHLTIVREYFDKQEWKYAYLDGSTKNRQEQVENFQNNENIRLFLISLKAGGLGLNLTRADYVFLLDPWWNPAIEAQAVDRAHRIGQKNKVFTYKFITRNTVEEKILALQQNKIRLASDLITTEESFIKKLDASDIASLLS
jgi:SNF2 family DNA or RNA helicase